MRRLVSLMYCALLVLLARGGSSFAMIQVDKTLTSPANTQIGGQLAYRIQLRSVGTGYTGVSVRDVYDASHFSFGGMYAVREVCASNPTQTLFSPGVSNISPVVTGSIGGLGTGCTINVYITGTLINHNPAGFSVINTGMVFSSVSPSISGSSSASFVIPPYTSLSVTQQLLRVEYSNGDVCTGSGCQAYGSGDRLVFRVLTTNTGNVAANVSLGATMAPGSFICGSTTGCNQTFSVGSGTTDSRLVSFVLQTNTLTNWSHTVTIREGAVSRGTAIVTGSTLGRAVVSLTKTTLNNAINQGPYYLNDVVSFRLTINNSQGTRIGTGQFMDVLPPNLQFVSAVVENPSAGSINANASSFGYVVNTGQTLTVLVTTRLASPSGVGMSFINTGVVFSSEPSTVYTQDISAASFTIHPRAELAITKTYRGMDGNGSHPYGNWYNGWQTVGFAITLTNTGNTTITGINVRDVLPSSLTYLTASIAPTSQSPSLLFSSITVPRGGSFSFIVTGRVNTETPGNFVNTASIVETTNCTPPFGAGNATNSLCRLIVTPSASASGQILGMARIGITKTTLAPYPLRYDARAPGVALPGPALPGDLLGFRLRVTNTGTRVATGLRVSDIFSSFVQNATFPTMAGLRLHQVGNTVVGINQGNDQNAVRDLVDVPAGGFVDVIITGMRQGATGIDVGRTHLNTGTIIDPFHQSGVVIAGGTLVSPRVSSVSSFQISEYMSGTITKDILGNTSLIGALSGDRVDFSLNRSNQGNTGFFFFVEDTLPQFLTFVGGQATATIPNNTPGRNYANGYDAIGTQIGTQHQPIPSFAGAANSSSVRRYHAPARFLPVNSSASVPVMQTVVGTDTFSTLTNRACLWFDDDWRRFQGSTNSFRGNVCDTASFSSRSQLSFQKIRTTQNPNEAGDLVGFEIRITNTGFSTRNGPLYIVDTFDPAFTIISTSPTATPTAGSSEVVTRTVPNASIPGQSTRSFFLTGRLNTAGWTYGDEYQNTATIASGENGLLYATVVATGVIGEPKLLLEKTRLSPNPYIPGDDVIFRIRVTNNGISPAVVQLSDVWPADLVDYVSSSIGAPTTTVGSTYTRNALTIPATGLDVLFTGRVRDGIIPSRVGSGFANTGMIRFGLSNQFTRTAIATGYIVPGMGMSASKKALQTGSFLGEEVTFRIDFRNTGNVAVRYDVTDFWPTQLDFVSADLFVGIAGPNGACTSASSFVGQYSLGEQKVVWNKNDLPILQPGEYGCALVVGKVNAASFACLDNSITIKYEDANQNQPLFQGIKTVQAADAICSDVSLRVQKNPLGIAPQRPGDPVAYEIIIANSGSRDATNVRILDNFPPEVIANATVQTAFSAAGGQNPLIPVSFVNALLWSGSSMVPTIPAQGSIRLVITGFLNTTAGSIGTSLLNTVCVRSSPQAVSSEICDDATHVVEPLADLYVTKTLTNTIQAMSGFEALFSLTIGNSGAQAVTGVRFEDVLSPQLSFRSHTLSPSLFAGQSYNTATKTLTLTGISLAPGSSQTFTLTAVLGTGYQSGQVVSNTARLHMPTGRENRERQTIFATPTNNIAFVTGTLTDFQQFDLLMNSQTQYAVSGSMVTVTMEVTGGTAGNVLLKAIVPAGFSFVDATAGYNIDDNGNVNWFLPPSSFAGSNPIITLRLSPNAASVVTSPKQIVGQLYYQAFPYTDVGGPQVVRQSTVLPIADMQITGSLTGYAPQLSGDTVTYCFAVANQGGLAISNAPVYVDDSVLTDNIDRREYRVDGGAWTTRSKTASLVSDNVLYPDHVSAVVVGGPLVAIGSPQNYTVGQTRSLCVRGSVKEQYPLGTAFALDAVVVSPSVEFTGSYRAGDNGNDARNTVTVQTTMQGIPDLYVQKTRSSGNPHISGDVVTFDLVIGNSGTQAVSGWTVQDMFPSSLTFTSGVVPAGLTGPSLVTGSRTLTRSGLILNPGQMYSLNLSFVLNQNYPQGLCFANTGMIAMPIGDAFLERGLTANNLSGASFCSLGSPDLWIRKEIIQGATILQSGDIVQYRLTFGNSGSAHVSGFSVQDSFAMYNSGGVVGGNTIGLGLTGVSASLPYTNPFLLLGLSEGYLQWNFGSPAMIGGVQSIPNILTGGLAPGQSYSIIVSGFVDNTYPIASILNNTARIGSLSLGYQSGDSATEYFPLANNSGSVVSIVGGAPNLVINKTHTGFVALSGDIVSYTLEVMNTGTLATTGSLTVTDVLPAGLTMVPGSTILTSLQGGSLTAPTPTIASNTITWTVPGGLAVGGGVRLSFSARLAQQLSGGTMLINTGRVSPLPLEYSFVDNVSTDTIEVGDVPGVSIRKTLVQSMSGVQGQEMMWHLDIANNARPGSGLATGVIMRDLLPVGFVAGTGACESIPSGVGCTFDAPSRTITSDPFTIDGGSSVRFVIRGILNYQPMTAFCVTNTGSVDVLNDLYRGDNVSSVQTCLASPVGVRVLKTAQPSWLGGINPLLGLDLMNATLSFTIRIENTGLIALPVASLTDVLTTAGGFVWASGTTIPVLASNFVLLPGESRDFIVNGSMTRRDFGTIVNEARLLLSGQAVPIVSSVTVPEPAAMCGDLILARGERCELLAGGGVLTASGTSLYEGQVCRNCQIVTERVVNCADICTDGYCTQACQTTDITQPKPSLSIDKTVRMQTQRNQGDLVEYTVRITNTGAAPAFNVLVTDTWPAGLTLVSFEQSPAEIFTFSTGSTPYQGTISQLNPGQSAVLVLRGRVSTAGASVVINTACAQADGPKVCDDVEIHINKPMPQPKDILLTKIADRSTVSSGDLINFTITLDNQTDQRVSGVVLTDVRPTQYLDHLSRRVTQGTPTNGIMSGLSLFSSLTFNLGVGERAIVVLQGRVRVSQDISSQNLARIAYTIDGSARTKEATAPFSIRPFGELCQSVTPRETRLTILSGGAAQSVTYTCNASSQAQNPRIRFNCGVGGADVVVDGTTLTTQCLFSSGGTYTPRCFVNEQTSSTCSATTIVTTTPFGVCGNGRVDAGEKCDLGGNNTVGQNGWLDTAQTVRDLSMVGRTCSAQCDLIGGNIPAPAQLCTYSDVPLSVMPGEILPFWRDIGYDEVSAVSSCSDAASEGKIVKNTMKCTFRLYHQGREPASYEQEITTDCTTDRRGTNELFKYFASDSLYSSTVQYADGKTYMTLGNDINDFGEYKMSLDRVEYQYCANGTQTSSSTARVCQSNFTIVDPYFIQKGFSSSQTDTSLDRYYNMDGSRTVESTELSKVKKVSANVLNPNTTLRSAIDTMIKKYTTPSILSTTTVNGQTLSKVKGKDIYVLQDGATYTESNSFNRPVAIIAQGNVTINGDISQSTMIIAKGTVSFTKDTCSRQMVNGIIVALGGYAADREPKRNNSLSNERCMDGGLTVKGLMIGSNLSQLYESKRSQLNRWFSMDGSQSINQQRTQMIYDGAAVSIQYNPQLWLSLPPIANEIGKELQTYR